jgi:hypothetical protein
MSALVTDGQRASRLWDKRINGDEVARKLNGARPSPSVLRIRTLIEHLQAISEKIAQLERICRESGLMDESAVSALGRWPLSDYMIDHPKVSPLAKEIKGIGDEISSSLWRYHWRPDVHLAPDGVMHESLQWPQLDDETSWENTTVQWLLSHLPTSLDGKGAFSHFLKCERCGDWFYAGREGAKFCRPACRVMAHVQTDEGKAQRALYMRKLRKLDSVLKHKKAQASPSCSRTRSEVPSKSSGPKRSNGRI